VRTIQECSNLPLVPDSVVPPNLVSGINTISTLKANGFHLTMIQLF